MPTYSVQFRRGTAIEHETFIGAQGEITVVTDDSTLRLHDGTTPGGHALADASNILTDISQYTDANGVLTGLAEIASGITVVDDESIYGDYVEAIIASNSAGTSVDDKTGFSTITNSGVTASNSVTKFADYSLYFDGASYLELPYSDSEEDPDLQFGGLKPFTIEAWVHPTNSTSPGVIVAVDDSTSSRQGFSVIRKTDGTIQFIGFTNFKRSSNVTLNSTSVVVNNAWTHIAVTFNGNNVKLFINGTVEDSQSVNPRLYPSTQNLTIGGYAGGTGNDKFVGYIDDVRVTNGVTRYTEDFTVPTSVLVHVLPAGPTAGWYGDRMVVHVGGRISAGASNALEYFDITTPGNASSFGTATVSTYYRGSCSNNTYGIWAGGGAEYGVDWTAAIDYVTIATTGQATTFGSATSGYSKWSGASDGTYGLFAGAERISYHYSLIEYITIATSGQAANFGDRTLAAEGAGSVSNGTYNIMAGGYHSNNFGTFYNVIDYVSYATPGTADDFGDLTVARYGLVGAGDLTRGLFAGSGTTVDYITMDTPGHATDWGDMLNSREFAAGASNGTYALITGGNPQASDRLTIQTLGSATSFGSLQSFPVEGSSGCSGSPS